MSAREYLCDLPGPDAPVHIVLDPNIRYLNLLQVLRAAGYDAMFDDRGEVLRITERRLS